VIRGARGLALVALAGAAIGAGPPVVPVIRQAPERCGPAALTMVLLAYGADSATAHEGDRAYDPALRGALITELAASARRAGYEARVATPGVDSLAVLLDAGIPPIVLFNSGIGPIVRGHYAVVASWDPHDRRFVLHDGGSKPRRMGRGDLERRWRATGGQALVVMPRER
jgi:hypothetical protein